MSGIKRWCVSRGVTVAESSVGPFVLHDDHLAAMAAASAYDEAAERKAAFEACPADFDWGMFWQGWKTCAKSRAKRAGGAE